MNAADILAKFASQTLPAVQADLAANVSQQVANLNAALLQAWRTASGNFLANWGQPGYTDPAAAPVPPPSWIVGNFTDPTSGPGTVASPYGEIPILWAYPSQTGPPIAPPLQLPAITPPQIHVATTGNERVMNVPLGDHTPVGQVRTDPVTGIQWIRASFPTPFGQSDEYLNVAYLSAEQLGQIRGSA